MGKSDNDSTSKLPDVVMRMPISQLNPYLTCALCNGYLIDATTMVECLHSFCRACLLSYFDQSATCPICETPINKTHWQKSIKSDQTLQDLVYKLVPGLYGSELKRRKAFYLDFCAKNSIENTVTSKSNAAKILHIFDKHLVDLASCICSPDEIVSFSVEFVKPPEETVDCAIREEKISEKNLNFKRFFRCPAAVKIGHLKKLLALKLDLPDRHKVSIWYGEDAQEDELTLMDIAFIYSWKRKTPLQLFFNVYKIETEEEIMPELHRQIEIPSVSPDSQAAAAAAGASSVATKNETSPDVPPAGADPTDHETVEKITKYTTLNVSHSKSDTPTKIRLKRSLISVVQKLSSDYHTVDSQANEESSKVADRVDSLPSTQPNSVADAPTPVKKPKKSRQSRPSPSGVEVNKKIKTMSNGLETTKPRKNSTPKHPPPAPALTLSC